MKVISPDCERGKKDFIKRERIVKEDVMGMKAKDNTVSIFTNPAI